MENAALVQNDLASFHAFVGEQLKRAGGNVSPEEALALWRERRETTASIERGLADVEAGRTHPASEAFEEFRRGLPRP